MGFEILSKGPGSTKPAGTASISRNRLALSKYDKQALGINGKVTVLVDAETKRIAVRAPLASDKCTFTVSSQATMTIDGALNRLGLTKKTKLTQLPVDRVDGMLVIDLSNLAKAL